MPQESQSQSHSNAAITSHPAVWPEQCRAGFGDANPHPGIICPSWGRRHHIMPCETKRYLVKEILAKTWPAEPAVPAGILQSEEAPPTLRLC